MTWSNTFNVRIAIVVFAGLLTADHAGAQGLTYTSIGTPYVGRVALEYVGMIKQDDRNAGKEFEVYGYFTHLDGLGGEQLYFDPAARNEMNARFTFHTKAKMTSRTQVGKVFNVNAVGEFRIYQHDRPQPLANFDDPEHFHSGREIATFEMRGQSIIVVTSENVGVNTAVFELTQLKDSWGAFKLGGKTYAVGAPGRAYRFSHVGRGDRTQEEPAIAAIAIAGNGIALSADN